VSAARTVHVVVPDGIDDPARPSGGNTYDRRLCDALGATGWSVHVHGVSGDWPTPGAEARRELTRTLDTLADGSVVLVDGLLASAVPDVMVPASARLDVVVLLHMPLGAGGGTGAGRRERVVLDVARAVLTTSGWSRRWLLAEYGLDPGRVHVALPGVDTAQPVARGGDGTSLLCVAAVTPGKGHDVLVEALSRIADRSWTCVCVGAVTREPDFVAGLRSTLLESGLDGRVVLAGPRTGRDLDDSYAGADALVLASRAETYGMVVTEALARAVPVLASDVGGVAEALGTTADGRRPGLLTPPGDVAALAGSLRRWLDEADLRRDLRAAARERRAALTGWPETADRVARVLAGATS
jgi:glycosyltransferase involved in cell wall biosynthesis